MRAIEFNHVRRHKPLDVYFIPIERCALMEIPKVLLETTCGRSADLEAFATTFFDFPSGGMMGNCFLLHDKRAQTFICSLVSMGEASSPVSVKAETPEKALLSFEVHCQRAGWWPENF